jgi:hypothetical protein
MRYFRLAAVSTLLGIAATFSATFFNLLKVHPTETELFAVEGTVLVNGEPAKNVHVAFHPLNNDRIASCPVGRTDGKGNFQLTTNFGADGAPACEYYVTFVWPDPLIEFDECEGPNAIIHDRFKGLYATPDQSGYQATVSNVEKNAFRFSLWRPRSDDPIP